MPAPGEHAPTILAKYPIIDEHVCDENAWQWLRGWAWLIFMGRGVSVDAELHYTTCRMMNGNASEWLRMVENDSHTKGNGWGGGHSMRICTLYDMHETEWEFFRLSHNWWTCMWWYGMTMHGNVWYWLIFKVTWPVGSVAATNGSSTSHSDTQMPTPGEHAPTILAKQILDID